MYANREFDIDGYLLLAAAILEAYREDYSSLFPKCCKTYADYQYQDITIYAPQRRHILENLKNGPIHSIIDYTICKRAFEQNREKQMIKYGIEWSEAYQINVISTKDNNL